MHYLKFANVAYQLPPNIIYPRKILGSKTRKYRKIKELMHNISLKRQAKRDAEFALHNQERSARFAKLIYVSKLAFKTIIPNKNFFEIALKTMLQHVTSCFPVRKHLQNC